MQDKLTKLKQKIEERNELLLSEISDALANNQDAEYNALKLQQVQCAAELRVINHIENNFEGDFLIS